MQVIIGIISVIVMSYFIWQCEELKKFQVTHYEMTTPKVEKEIKIAVISDLHSFSYGKDNELLFQSVQAAAVDLILIPGDLIVTDKIEKYEIALQFVRRLCTLGIPVICTNGNHESKAELPQSDSYVAYRKYHKQLEQSDATILNNQSCKIELDGMLVHISGLELPLSCYKKGRKPYLEKGYLHSQLGTASKDYLQILLAHQPAFAKQYAAWGADITVCGHNHGGLIRIPGKGSVISPQFVPFPEYDAGEFTVSGKKIYISRGLGTHTFHIRICNRAELVVIAVKPEK